LLQNSNQKRAWKEQVANEKKARKDWRMKNKNLVRTIRRQNLVTEKDLERAGKSEMAQSEDDATLEGEITANNQQIDD
jgi:hypothetical protein